MTPHPESISQDRFLDFLKQVEASGTRTRSLIYAILIFDFLVVCSIRNTEIPNWSNAYLHQINLYYECWVNNGDCKKPPLGDILKLPDRDKLSLDFIKGDTLNEGNAVQKEM